MERKYKQRGYQDVDKPQKKEKRSPEGQGHPRQEQIGPRTPRMVGTITRARCANCGAVLVQGFDPAGKCPRCGLELHCCKQCVYFDTAEQFECVQPILERIARKDEKNDCTFYQFRTTVEKDTAPSAPAPSATPSERPAARPSNARQAFEDLFKK